MAGLQTTATPTADAFERRQAAEPHPLRDRQIGANVALSFVANAAASLSSWAILIYLTRAAQPLIVGQFVFAFALTAPVMMFADLRLRTVLVADVRGEYHDSEFLALRVAAASAALIVATAVAWLVRPELTGVVFWVATAKACDLLSDVFYGVQQQSEKVTRVAVSRAVQAVAQLGAFIFIFRRSGSLTAAAVALAAASALTLEYDRRAAARVRAGAAPRGTGIRLHAVRTLFLTSLPLGFALLFAALYNTLARIAVDFTLGTTALGIFAAIGYLQTAGGLVIAAMSTAAMPRLAGYFARQKAAEFRRLIAVLVTGGFALGALGLLMSALAGPLVLRTVYGTRYADRPGLLVALMAVSAIQFGTVFWGTAIAAARDFRITPWAQLAGCAVIGAVAFPLARAYGEYGVVMAMAAASMTIALIHRTRYQRLLRSIETDRSQRVLHVFRKLDHGGAELRTLDVLRALAGSTLIDTHIVLLSGEAGDLDGEFRRAGATLHYVRMHSIVFPLRFFALLRRDRIDAIHSHVHYFSGYLLALAWLAGVRKRICHFRSTSNPPATSVLQRMRRRVGRALVGWSATSILAVSADAMTSAFRTDWERDPRCRVIYNGFPTIDRRGAELARMRSDARAEFAFADDDTVICHVGRFDELKNHDRLVEIFKEVARRTTAARLLLVGDGDPAIQRRVREKVSRLHLDRKVVFAGVRDDTPRLLAGSDVLLFPSFCEGLPGAVIEALSVGTPCVASAIPGTREIAQFSTSLDLLPLEHADECWAASVESAAADRSLSARVERSRDFDRVPFDVATAADALLEEWTRS